MGTRENAKSRKGVLFAMVAAMVMALALSLCMTQPAEAASTSKPYAGYKNTSKEVVCAGYIQMHTYDARKVKAGMGSFYVWSGNSKLYDAKGNYTKTATVLKKYKMKGVTYNKKKNTLTLKNVKAPTYTLDLRGMGTGFKIKLVGKNQLAGIESDYSPKYNNKGEYIGSYPSGLSITGSGSLVVNKNKYNYAAISISASGTGSVLSIDKKASVKLYAYGTGNVVSVNATTQKKAAKAISIKGWPAEDLQWSSQTNKPYVQYERESVTVLETAASTYPLYKVGTGAQLYYEYGSSSINESVDTGNVDEYGDPIYEDVVVMQYELRPVEPVAKVKNVQYYAYDSSKPTVTKKASEITKVSGSAKVITYTYGYDYMTKLNSGAYYAMAGSKNIRYWDSSTRREINSKWHIYKKVAKVNGVIYVTSYKDNVANKGLLPKGYKGKKEQGSSNKATYTHVLKNNMLTIAA